MQKSIPHLKSFDELNYPYETYKLELEENLEIAYMDEGSGDPIIFIHGLGSYGPAWKKTVAGLSENNRCIVIDLPGYGKSSKGNYEGTMSYYADVVKKITDKLNIKKVTLAGHSMGGQISILAALAYPGLVENLLLISPAGFEIFTPGQKQWFREVLTPQGVKLTPVDVLISNVGFNFYDFPKDAQFMIDDRIAMRSAEGFNLYCHQIVKSINGMVDEPIFDYLKDLKVPTLVIFGSQDNLIPNRFLNPGKTEKIAQMGAEQIPNCRLEMIDKAGHFVHFEKAMEVNAIVKEFLK
jgi:pimeloyl-ACP methyl ester carboxylesterase